MHLHVSRSHDDRVNASLGMIKTHIRLIVLLLIFLKEDGGQRETDRIRESGGQTEVVIDLNSLHLSKSII